MADEGHRLLGKDHLPFIRDNITRLLMVGAPGAGTTLLESCVGAHPDVGILDEDKSLKFLTIIGKPVVGTKLCIPNHIQYDRRSRFFGPDLDYRFRVSSALLNFIQLIGLGRHRPHCHFSIRDLQEILPDLKIIAIIRERDKTTGSAARTIKEAGDVPSFTPGEKLADWWYEAATLTIRSLQERGECLVVKYDDLLSSPETTLQAVTRYLGIEFDKRMLRGPEFSFRYPRKAIGVGMWKKRTSSA